MKAPEFIENMDWKLLKEQKKTLLGTIKAVNTLNMVNDLQGLLNLVDAIQDYACDELGFSSEEVFDIEEE